MPERSAYLVSASVLDDCQIEQHVLESVLLATPIGCKAVLPTTKAVANVAIADYTSQIA